MEFPKVGQRVGHLDSKWVEKWAVEKANLLAELKVLMKAYWKDDRLDNWKAEQLGYPEVG